MMKKKPLKKEKFDVIEENKLLKSDIETKNDMNNILQGKVSSLELQYELKVGKLNKYTKMMNKMHLEVKRLREQLGEKGVGIAGNEVGQTIWDLKRILYVQQGKLQKLS